MTKILLAAAIVITASAAQADSIVCTSASSNTVFAVRMTKLTRETGTQLFRDVTVEERGVKNKGYMLNDSVLGSTAIQIVTSKGDREYSLSEEIRSHIDAKAELEGSGLITYNSEDAAADYLTLSKDKKDGEHIVMLRSKIRGQGVYPTPLLVKCSQK